MLLSCTVAVVLTALLLPVVTSVTEAVETGAAATGHYLNHPDETGTAGHRLPTTASTSLNHPDETGAAAHRLPTTASTSLNHPDETGTAAHRLPTTASTSLNHPDETGTAAHRLPTTASTSLNHPDETGTAAHRLPTTASTSLNHPDETGTAAHRLPTTASTSLNHPDETGTAAHRLPTTASTSLNHPDETGTAAHRLPTTASTSLNHPDETGTAAHRLPTTASTSLNHPDETGTAAHRLPTTASTSLNHPDETGTAAHRLPTTASTSLNHPDETGTAAHRLPTTASTSLNHPDETGTAAHRLPTTASTSLNHPDETGTAAHRLPTTASTSLNHPDETGTAAHRLPTTASTSLNHPDETGTAAHRLPTTASTSLNHPDETGTAAHRLPTTASTSLNHPDETGTAAHRLPTTASTSLNHPDETGTAAHRLPTTASTSLNHPDETGTAAHRLPTTASTSLNHPDETGTAAHRLPTTASTSLNHPDETGTAAHRLPTTASTSLGHPVDAGTAAAGHHRMPTSPYVGHADDQTVENLMEETPSSAPSDDENIDEYRMTQPTTTQTIKPMNNGTVKRDKRGWWTLAKVGWSVVQQLIPGATSWFCRKRAEHCYCGLGRCVDKNTYMKGDSCCSEGRVYACCPDEPSTPAPILEHCPMVERKHLKKVCLSVTAVFPRTAGKCWMESGETHKFICSCPSLLGSGYGEQRGVCVKDCKTIKQDMVCDCGWGNCEEPRRIFDTSLYLWVCGCCASRPLILQIFIDKVVCVETKEVAPTNETMATTESIPTDAVNETKLDWNQCQKLAQQHCLCGWATCRQREPGYNASLCCAAGYELQCCDSDSERTVVNPLQCRVAHHIKFGQDILVEYSTTGCDASSHFCYMAHCYKRTDPDQSYTEWGCKQTKTECGVKERLATWMGRDLVNANGASFEDMECSDCQKGPEGISMSNEKMTPWETPMPKPGKLFAPASSIKVRCTNKHRCFPTFLERGELTGQQQMTFKLKGQYVVRRTQDEAVQLHCDQTVPLLCKAADGFLNEFIFDEFYKQTKNGAFLDEYTKVRASC
ncbi:hypothetical protein GPALN_005926 [Globodera pallida]|nr:hypothetical protein GPALN_005926 [Globodera pallida]